MFIKNSERKGGCYFEFQFCRKENPVRDGKADVDAEHWLDDSILLSDDDFDIFFEKYGKCFECAVFPNGERGFDYCGLNYYSPDCTAEIYETLKKCIDDEYTVLIEWLDTALKAYNGFYIMGL